MRSNRKAFSLLEAFLALSICAGLLISVVSVVNYHLKVVSRYKQHEGLYAEAGNTFELIKKRSAVYQGHLAEPFADYTYQANVISSPYHGIDLLTMKVSGLNEDFTFSEYILGVVEGEGINENKS